MLVNAGKGKRAGGCGNALFQGFLTIRLSELLHYMTLSCVKNTAFDSAFKQYSTLEGILQILQKHSFFIHIYIYIILSQRNAAQ